MAYYINDKPLFSIILFRRNLEEMNQLIRKDVKDIFSFKFILIWFALIITPIVYNLIRVKEYSLLDPLDFYTLIISTILPLFFPIVVVIIYLVTFSRQISNNFILYTRLRIDIKKYLGAKFITNAIVVFFVMFSSVFIPFIFAFYIEPLLGIIVYEPENSGLSTSELIKNTYQRYTFSQLLEYGSFTYGFLYAVWVGVNSVIYTSLGFFALLLINNRFLALSIPFLLYHLGSFIIAVLNYPMLLLDASIFPFNITQYPIWIVCLPLLFLFLVCMGLYIYTKRNLYRLDSIK